MEELKIQMLGGFSLKLDDRELQDTDTRSKKVWVLLAYLIIHREQTVTQRTLIDLLWGDEPESTNPENALRITMHRTRTLLEQLSPELGRGLILRRKGGYQWNGGGKVDSERFEALCRQNAEDPELRLRNLLEAISLYRGDFLPHQSGEVWVVPIASYLHNLFLSAAQEAVELLIQRGRNQEAAGVCRRCLALEPYHEGFCRELMQLLAAAGDRRGAAEAYDRLSKRLFDDFGISPSEQTRTVYRATVHSPENRVLSIDEVMGTVRESDAPSGALQCDFDYFRILCYALSRAMERSGNAAHVVLLDVISTAERELPRQSIDRVMGQLSQQIRLSLRRGDVFCQCSISQFVVLLGRANFENSQVICDRILRAFHRAYPYAPVRITYQVRPLSPERPGKTE
ncbi:MAG: BTAD domain-containing putative transcriptional regulator [Candidatus Faecousia sp.]|nr:BTAD domain-containing putative transcriptional regulator [Candidatus Faecousia sp.]